MWLLQSVMTAFLWEIDVVTWKLWIYTQLLWVVCSKIQKRILCKSCLSSNISLLHFMLRPRVWCICSEVESRKCNLNIFLSVTWLCSFLRLKLVLKRFEKRILFFLSILWYDLSFATDTEFDNQGQRNTSKNVKSTLYHDRH